MTAVTYFVLFFCQVHALSLMIPALVLSKIYANSLLAVFNSRVNIIRGRIYVPEAMSDPLVFPKSAKGSTIPHYNIGKSRTEGGTEMSAMTIDLTTSCVSRRGNPIQYLVGHGQTKYHSSLQTRCRSQTILDLQREESDVQKRIIVPLSWPGCIIPHTTSTVA